MKQYNDNGRGKNPPQTNKLLKIFDLLIPLTIVNVILMMGVYYNMNQGFTMYKDFDVLRGDALGMYIKDSYYCVSTTGLNESYINEIELHEMCHHVVRQDPEHFCKDEGYC